jgi:hypothetical protein
VHVLCANYRFYFYFLTADDKMIPFLIVILQEGNQEDQTRRKGDNEIIPSTWYHDGLCSLPSKNILELADKCEMLKMAWKRYTCKVLSSHGNSYFSCCNCILLINVFIFIRYISGSREQKR